MNCPTGGYPTLRHSELCDFTAKTISEVYTNVCIEPSLWPVSWKTCDCATANAKDGTQLDVCATRFWCSCHHKNYFDVKVFQP